VPDNFVHVYVYAINASTGHLAGVNGSPFTTGGTYPSYVAFDPSGKCAYVSNYYSSYVTAHYIDASTGALWPMPGSPFAMSGNTSGSYAIAVDPAGKFVYVLNMGSGNISVFSRDTSTGALTEVSGSPFKIGSGSSTGPASIAIDPWGKFAFVSDFFANSVSVFALDGLTGAITEIAGSPYGVGNEPIGLAIAHIKQ
jgi:DNA-binding beta-propeller fold protein YncE